MHINAQNRAQDDSNDPIVQIGRVLNAHMDSLQWVDQSMVQVCSLYYQINFDYLNFNSLF